MRIPKHFNAREPASRRNLGAALRSRLAEIDLDPARSRPPRMNAEVAREITDLRERLSGHPCHSCPDREQHARRAEKALFGERENARAQERASSRTNTIATHFDKICLVLASLGYLEAGRDADGDKVTDAGRMLGRIYAELDLVAAECIRAGVFAGLSAPQLAAVLSALVYESRRCDEGVRGPRMPDAETETVMTPLRQDLPRGVPGRAGRPAAARTRARHRLQLGRVRLGGRSPAGGRAGRRSADRRRLRPLGAPGAGLRRPGGRRRRAGPLRDSRRRGGQLDAARRGGVRPGGRDCGDDLDLHG